MEARGPKQVSQQLRRTSDAKAPTPPAAFLRLSPGPLLRGSRSAPSSPWSGAAARQVNGPAGGGEALPAPLPGLDLHVRGLSPRPRRLSAWLAVSSGGQWAS
ncbi:hypothetical protein VULLAG_LOCUS22068 [Vulpes lagopus]